MAALAYCSNPENKKPALYINKTLQQETCTCTKKTTKTHQQWRHSKVMRVAQSSRRGTRTIRQNAKCTRHGQLKQRWWYRRLFVANCNCKKFRWCSCALSISIPSSHNVGLLCFWCFPPCTKRIKCMHAKAYTRSSKSLTDVNISEVSFAVRCYSFSNF